MASSTASKTRPILQPETPFLQRIIFNARVLIAQLMTTLLLTYVRYVHRFPPPNQIKSFPSHSHLKNRIFFPPVQQPHVSPPLFLDIHGGGFALMKPSLDDKINTYIAKELNCLVISLDYSKAPAAKFPTATNEIIDTILDILADETLVFDRSRVVLGGHSAGGTLTISCAQSPRLRGKLAGVVPWYPATDFSDDPAPKALLRPYDFPGEADGLIPMIPFIKYAYIAPGQDLRDPRLSTLYTDRTTLPKYIMIIGAENDFLAHEAWRQAKRFAGEDDTVNWDDDKDAKYGFEKDGIRFLLVRGAKHAFTHFMGQRGEAEVRRKKQEEECWREVKFWLQEGPFAEKK